MGDADNKLLKFVFAFSASSLKSGFVNKSCFKKEFIRISGRSSGLWRLKRASETDLLLTVDEHTGSDCYSDRRAWASFRAWCSEAVLGVKTPF